MSPGDRCEHVMRLIDEALDDRSLDVRANGRPEEEGGPVSTVVTDPSADVQEVPGHWGVYYLRPV